MATQTLSITGPTYNGFEDSGVWEDDTVALSTSNTIGLTFIATAQIPAGATINSAYVRLYCQLDDTTDLTAVIAVEDADPGTNTVYSSGHLPSASTYYGATSTGSVNIAADTWHYGNGELGATNIAAGIQSLLNEYGTIEVGEVISIRIQRSAGSGEALFESFGEAPSNEPELFIDWTPSASGQPSAARKNGIPGARLGGQTFGRGW